MTKLRKQRRRKVYKYNVNRKRMRNKIFSVGNIACKEIKNEWNIQKSVETNLTQMGLSYDPNKTIAIPTRGMKIGTSISNDESEWLEENMNESQLPSKKHVAEALAADAKAPREKKFRLPKPQVEWVTYLMKKYGKDYRAMARDNKNYYQETWKQLRQKIRTFKKIPAQYENFLKQNDFTANDFDSNDDMTDDEL